VPEMLITGSQLLTGREGERIQDGAVLIRGTQICAVGSLAEVTPQASTAAERVSCPGATILPGLIDCHVHLAFDASADFVTHLQSSSDQDLADQAGHRARVLLAAGITTVRDLGDRGNQVLHLRDAINAGHLAGPRILAAGAPLTRPGGHCWFLGGEVDGPDAIRNHIRASAAAGVDVVKVMATGGHLTPGGAAMWESQFELDDLRLIVEEARHHGLPVAAHAHGTAGIAAATAAGVSTLEHCTWLGPAGAAPDPEVRRRIIDSGTYVCPAVSRNWKGFPQRFGQQLTTILFEDLRQAEQEGMLLAAGTDSGVPGAVFGDYVEALEMFAHLGIPNSRTLSLATVDAAAAVGLGSVTGRLAPGLSADVLVVGGDPLAKLDALKDVRHVIARGVPYRPDGAAAQTQP
jgi:imidazolonepropionase-like amidohydrolase